jgi:hypothetical protein
MKAINDLKQATQEIKNHFGFFPEDVLPDYHIEDRRWAYWWLTETGITYGESEEKAIFSDKDSFSEIYRTEKGKSIWEKDGYTAVMTHAGFGAIRTFGIYDNTKKIK